MLEINHPPDAPALLESMRSIGYSLESAIADLIDNSISAKCKNVWIEFRPEPLPYVALLDDGNGMAEVVLENAMRHGSSNPLTARDESDLGRYGLGLKTASLSQCRVFTVVSKTKEGVFAYRWDLDRVLLRKAWTLLKLTSKEIESLAHVSELKKLKSGTLIIWESLDRMMAGETSVERAMGQKMAVAREHISLVFHRYIQGESGLKPLKLYFNLRELDPIDPFLLDHVSTQRLSEDSFAVERKRVTVKPFILPYISKLSANDILRAGGSEGLRHHQGFYVYRNKRLIIWGTWFRLARKDELSKLARVRVDVPNSLDHLWTIDVKKSMAVPPEAVRVNLKRTIEKIRQVSTRTLVYRGRQENLGLITTGWKEFVNRGGVRFDINREHPAITSLVSNLPKKNHRQFESVLRVIEQSFPADALYARLATDHRNQPASSNAEQNYRELVQLAIENIPSNNTAKKIFLESLHLIEPFSVHPEIARTIAQEFLS
jgi:hypothetical protein